MARKMKKFAEGGTATQQARYNRKIADINSDYDKWLKSGRYGNEAVARAKRDQRLADAADDLAKWTGEDRSKTRAGEAAAEATLREARRTKGASMPPPPRQIEAPLSSEPIKIAPQKMDLGDVAKQAKPAGSDNQTFNSAFRAARANALSGGPKTFTWRGRVYGTKLADEDSSPRPRPRLAAQAPAATYPKSGTTYSGDALMREQARLAAQDVQRRAIPPAQPAGNTSGSANPAPAYNAFGDRPDALHLQRQREARARAEENWRKAGETLKGEGYKKGGTVKKKACGGGMMKKYAKGGSIDGCAVRGKTRAKRAR